MVSLWLERSNLKFRQVVGRIQSKGILLSEAALADRLTRRPERLPNIEPTVTVAVIQAFTERLLPCERCQAGEALQFANLTRLPLSQINYLQKLFPMQEFEQALQQYLDIPMPSQTLGAQVMLPQTTHPHMAFLLNYKQPISILPFTAMPMFPAPMPSTPMSSQPLSRS